MRKKKNFVFWIDFYQKNVIIFSGIKLFFYKQVKQMSYVKETPPSNGLILRKLCATDFHLGQER